MLHALVALWRRGGRHRGRRRHFAPRLSIIPKPFLRAPLPPQKYLTCNLLCFQLSTFDREVNENGWCSNVRVCRCQHLRQPAPRSPSLSEANLSLLCQTERSGRDLACRPFSSTSAHPTPCTPNLTPYTLRERALRKRALSRATGERGGQPGHRRWGAQARL